MRLYRNESSDPKTNAQRNLCGRTHYVDDETLRWHKSRVLSARVVDEGLLFAIVTSDALDMNNTKRGYRFVVFDVFGTVLERPKLEESYRTSEKAAKAMWEALNAIDARSVTLAALDKAESDYKREVWDFRELVRKMESKAA